MLTRLMVLTHFQTCEWQKNSYDPIVYMKMCPYSFILSIIILNFEFFFIVVKVT